MGFTAVLKECGPTSCTQILWPFPASCIRSLGSGIADLPVDPHVNNSEFADIREDPPPARVPWKFVKATFGPQSLCIPLGPLAWVTED